ncbi:hypothetical protein Acsp02_23410 [Actinoplanes sp. NBRC 103695]|nr:hypothetical protein Acsp02_23410 [Actinoplanes sp. NBRC 103695]
MLRCMADPERTSLDPGQITTFADLLRELRRLRVRAARGRGKPKLSIQDIAVTSGTPKSSLANYLSGATVIPADVLDAVVLAMGATPVEAVAWAKAWERAMDHHLAHREDTPAPALTGVDDGGTPAAPPVPDPVPTRTPRRRRAAALVAAGALGIVIVAAAGGAYLLDVPATPADPGPSAPSLAGPAAPIDRLRCVPVTGDWDERDDPRDRAAPHGSMSAGTACRTGISIAWRRVNQHAGVDPLGKGSFGNFDECLPVTGDWDGDGRTTAGIACQVAAPMIKWSLINGFAGSSSFLPFSFGETASCWPVTGDWDGDGTTTAGAACREGDRIRWDLINRHATVTPSYSPFVFGDAATCRPVTGDWDGNGTTTAGAACRDGDHIRWHLTNTHASGAASYPPFIFGDATSCRPVTGDWDGNGTTTAGTACRGGTKLIWSFINSPGPAEPAYPPFALGTDGTYPVSHGWPGPPWPDHRVLGR